LERVDQPFFAWAHYMDIHWPYHLEESLTHPRQLAQAWQDLAIMNGRSNFDRRELITTAQRAHFIGLYEQSLQYLDAQIGRLIAQTDHMGLGANTVIIVVADHGEEFLDHGRWGHWESNLFDEIVRVPLIIRVPNAPQGQVVYPQVHLIDLMPTILELCGCPLPDGLMGRSLTPLWTGRVAEFDDEVAISEMRRDPWHRIAVRTEAFKYIWDSRRPQQPELYDLKADPFERQNVAVRFPQEVSRFQATVEAHLRRVAETTPALPAPALQLEDEVTRRLRDLGYLE
jgi:arylsulfatase A-like enzyme